MISYFLMMLLTLGYQAFLSAMTHVLHAQNSLCLVAPLVIAIAVFCLSILEAMLVLFGAGILLDALTGSIMGVNMLLLVFLGLLSKSLVSWLGKPHWPMVFSVLFAISCFYRIAWSQFAEWGWASFLLGPWLDAAIGILVFYLLPQRVFKMD